jgi:hypothetical protein
MSSDLVPGDLVSVREYLVNMGHLNARR